MKKTLTEAFGKYPASFLKDHAADIGASKILFAGNYGSQIKGYARPNSDHDVYVVFSYGAEQAQQMLFKTQEPFETPLATAGEHAFDSEDLDTKKQYQFKLISLQHFISQVCGSNYCMLQAALNPEWADEKFRSAMLAIQAHANFTTDLVSIAQSKYRAAFRMANSVLESDDRKGAGNRQDRRMAESSSRLVDAVHGYMTAQLIRQEPPYSAFVTDDFTELLLEYEELPERPIEPALIHKLIAMHLDMNVEEKEVYAFVCDHIAPKIIESREAFDKFSLPRNDKIIARRREFSETIHRESLKASL